MSFFASVVLIFLVDPTVCFAELCPGTCPVSINRRMSDIVKFYNDKHHTSCDKMNPTYMVKEKQCIENKILFDRKELYKAIIDHACMEINLFRMQAFYTDSK